MPAAQGFAQDTQRWKWPPPACPIISGLGSGTGALPIASPCAIIPADKTAGEKAQAIGKEVCRPGGHTE